MEGYTAEAADAVIRMQEYIKKHVLSDDFSFKEMYLAGGYSRRHGDRIFKFFLGKTPAEYVRAVRLSESARKLADGNETVLSVALDSGFTSHEGYAKAFASAFHIKPVTYRKEPVAIPLFVEYPLRDYFALLQHNEEMKTMHSICMITPVQKPERKLILLRSKNAEDYLSFCEEMGCEWEGLFNSIPEKLDTAALVELPEKYRIPNTSAIAAGVEVPADYEKVLPEGCDFILLKSTTMLCFQSEPFDKEETFCQAMDIVYHAADVYNPESHGYRYCFDCVPKFNYGAYPETGARLEFPVEKN